MKGSLDWPREKRFLRWEEHQGIFLSSSSDYMVYKASKDKVDGQLEFYESEK